MNVNFFASDLVSLVFKVFNTENIKYVVLRNYELLPENNDSKDVDILVAPESIEKSISLLIDSAQKMDYQLIWKNKLDYLQGFVFSKIKENRIYSIKLDIFNGLMWRGKFYIDHNIILSRAIEYNGLKVPLKSHESFIMIVYYILYAKNIRKKYLIPIYINAINDLYNFKLITEKTFRSSLSREIILLVENNNVSSLVKLRKKIINNLIFYNLVDFKYFFRLFYHIKTEYLDRNYFGTLISFSGSASIDKSKNINTFNQFFYSLGITKNETSYRLFSSKILKLSLFKSINKLNFHVNVNEQNLLTKPLYYFFAFLFDRFIFVRNELRSNQVIFFDTYHDDFTINYEEQLNGVEKYFFKLLPSSDNVFIISEDMNCTIDNDEADLLQAYSKLPKTISNCKILRCSGNSDEDTIMVLEEIFGFLEKRYS